MSQDSSETEEDRMDVHNNARLTPKGREAMVRAVVEQGLNQAEAARRGLAAVWIAA